VRWPRGGGTGVTASDGAKGREIKSNELFESESRRDERVATLKETIKGYWRLTTGSDRSVRATSGSTGEVGLDRYQAFHF